MLDLGYSTPQRSGGTYPSYYGGALETILSYAANSRYVKIGSLVYVSHGVIVATRTWLSAGTAIAGHATRRAGATGRHDAPLRPDAARLAMHRDGERLAAAVA